MTEHYRMYMKLLRRLVEDREKPDYVDDDDVLLDTLDHEWWKLDEAEVARMDFEMAYLYKLVKFFEWNRR